MHRLKMRVLALALMTVCNLCLYGAARAVISKPTVIFIMADDMSRAGGDCLGGKHYRAPKLNARLDAGPEQTGDQMPLPRSAK
jgi:hypothetical protein